MRISLQDKRKDKARLTASSNRLIGLVYSYWVTLDVHSPVMQSPLPTVYPCRVRTPYYYTLRHRTRLPS